MSEQLQAERQHVSVVIYDDLAPPRYLRIPKRSLKTFFVLLPVIICLLALVAAGSWYFSWRLKNPVSKPDLPIGEQTVPMAEVVLLKETLAELKSSNETLNGKLNQLATAEEKANEYLGPIRRPYAFQNLTTENRLKLDQVLLSSTANQVEVKFNIVSNRPENERTAGHVMVLLSGNNFMRLYPAANAEQLRQGVRFDHGESFAVSRIRPVHATFQMPETDARDLQWKVIILSREGDLLLVQEGQQPREKNQ